MSGAAINIIVAPWFERRRGLALGWALNGASGGGIIIAPLLTFLTARFGFPLAIVSVTASIKKRADPEEQQGGPENVVGRYRR
jgi:MFS family permease